MFFVKFEDFQKKNIFLPKIDVFWPNSKFFLWNWVFKLENFRLKPQCVVNHWRGNTSMLKYFLPKIDVFWPNLMFFRQIWRFFKKKFFFAKFDVFSSNLNFFKKNIFLPKIDVFWPNSKFFLWNWVFKLENFRLKPQCVVNHWRGNTSMLELHLFRMRLCLA